MSGRRRDDDVEIRGLSRDVAALDRRLTRIEWVMWSGVGVACLTLWRLLTANLGA